MESELFSVRSVLIEYINPESVAIKDKPTPKYNTECGGVKKDSTLTTPCQIMSQLAAPTCSATPIETRK